MADLTVSDFLKSNNLPISSTNTAIPVQTSNNLLPKDIKVPSQPSQDAFGSGEKTPDKSFLEKHWGKLLVAGTLLIGTIATKGKLWGKAAKEASQASGAAENIIADASHAVNGTGHATEQAVHTGENVVKELTEAEMQVIRQEVSTHIEQIEKSAGSPDEACKQLCGLIDDHYFIESVQDSETIIQAGNKLLTNYREQLPADKLFDVLDSLAGAHSGKGNFEEVEKCLKEMPKIARGSSKKYCAYEGLAGISQKLGRPAEETNSYITKAFYHRLKELFKVGTAVKNAESGAQSAWSRGDLMELGGALLKRTQKMQEILEPNHPTLKHVNELAEVLKGEKPFDEVLGKIKETIEQLKPAVAE